MRIASSAKGLELRVNSREQKAGGRGQQAESKAQKAKGERVEFRNCLLALGSQLWTICFFLVLSVLLSVVLWSVSYQELPAAICHLLASDALCCQ